MTRETEVLIIPKTSGRDPFAPAIILTGDAARIVKEAIKGADEVTRRRIERDPSAAADLPEVKQILSFNNRGI